MKKFYLIKISTSSKTTNNDFAVVRAVNQRIALGMLKPFQCCKPILINFIANVDEVCKQVILNELASMLSDNCACVCGYLVAATHHQYKESEAIFFISSEHEEVAKRVVTSKRIWRGEYVEPACINKKDQPPPIVINKPKGLVAWLGAFLLGIHTWLSSVFIHFFEK